MSPGCKRQTACWILLHFNFHFCMICRCTATETVQKLSVWLFPFNAETPNSKPLWTLLVLHWRPNECFESTSGFSKHSLDKIEKIELEGEKGRRERRILNLSYILYCFRLNCQDYLLTQCIALILSYISSTRDKMKLIFYHSLL